MEMKFIISYTLKLIPIEYTMRLVDTNSFREQTLHQSPVSF